MKNIAKCVSLLFAATLAGCGGGGGGGSDQGSQNPPPEVIVPQVGSVSPPTYQEARKNDAFNRINEIRQMVGLGLVAQSLKLDAAAQNHANYIINNGDEAHNETFGKSGFTGIDPGFRIEFAGYNYGWYGEVISYDGKLGGAGQIDELTDGVYHRAILLNYGFVDVGIGDGLDPNRIGFRPLVVDFAWDAKTGRQESSRPFVVWPMNGSILTRLVNPPEIPTPPGAGYAVSVNVDSRKSLAVTRFELKEAGSISVPGTIITPSNSFAALSPTNALKPNTSYTVTFEGTVDGQPLSTNWAFSTR